MQDLYLFNPDNEISIANGTNGYTPKANIAIMAGDLADGPILKHLQAAAQPDDNAAAHRI